MYLVVVADLFLLSHSLDAQDRNLLTLKKGLLSTWTPLLENFLKSTAKPDGLFFNVFYRWGY
jgi:hypothetical protein